MSCFQKANERNIRRGTPVPLLIFWIDNFHGHTFAISQKLPKKLRQYNVLKFDEWAQF